MYMDTETKLENELEAMGFEIDIETDDGVSEVFITKDQRSYVIYFWNGDAHVAIRNSDKIKRFKWYESALRFIIKHYRGI